MDITQTDIPGVMLVVPRRIGDARGYFAETFRADLFAQACGEWAFVQDNESRSSRAGTVRGLHFQSAPRAQGKLVRCTAGALFDVAVDIRRGSPTYGQWTAATLTPGNGHQLWLPPGLAHGFCSLEPDTVIAYKVTAPYDPACDKGLAWDDPDIAIAWPAIADAGTLSGRDRRQPALADLPPYFAAEDVVARLQTVPA